MNPLVSVAIPVYNGANYMREAIDSVLAQTYSNLEVLVVNDGSRDAGETERIALTYGEKIRYFSKPNGGVASALNLALQAAQGDYFCWLSHDDIYFPDKVAKEIEKLLSLDDPNSVVFCRHSIINADGKYLYDAPTPPRFSPHRAAYQLILGQWLHCCTILAPKSLYIESGGFREDLPSTQDYDLLVKIGLRHPFVELPEILLKARSHPEQGCLTFSHLKEVERFFEEHIPLLSAEYMSANFTPHESVEAFLALGRQMRDRQFPNSVLAVAKQLISCEARRAEPGMLWDALYQLTMKDYPVACQQTIVQTDQYSTAPYAENKLKLLARRWLPKSAWDILRKIRNRMQFSVVPAVSNQTAVQIQGKPRIGSLDFDEIYKNNGFAGTESLSGEGSSLFQTRIIREEIPKLLKELGVRRMLDVPCGDWNWMRYVDLTNIDYIGGDIVKTVVDSNNKLYGNEIRKFEQLNIITGPLPEADVILCRDCLVHLNFADGLAVLEQFRQSGAKWLLTTTFITRENNVDLYEGDVWRPLNLEKTPYNLPKPERYINEGCTEYDGLFSDKCLGLWKIN